MAIKNGIGQSEQQRLNRAFVIELLRQKRLCSRSDLSKDSGLKRATITNIINEFIESGLVVEDGLLEGDKGRRSIGIRVNGARYRVIGVMVTRGSYSIGLIGLSGEVYRVSEYNIEKGTCADDIIKELRENIDRLLKKEADYQVLAIGVALPGPYKREKGEMIFVTNLIGWEHVSVHSRLQEGFDIPVFVENDANAGAYAQYWFAGAGDTHLRDLAYIVAGYGIGSGLILDGDVVHGVIGMAGEIGHTTIQFEGPRCGCGNRGCLEMYCSLLALKKRVTAGISKGADTCLEPGFTMDELEQAVRAQDPLALREYVRVCEYLAVGIVNLVNQLNPQIVIIGDRLAEMAPKLMLETVRARVHDTVRPLVWESLHIEINQLEHNPILVGAGAIAAQQVFVNPLSYIA